MSTNNKGGLSLQAKQILGQEPVSASRMGSSSRSNGTKPENLILLANACREISTMFCTKIAQEKSGRKNQYHYLSYSGVYYYLMSCANDGLVDIVQVQRHPNLKFERHVLLSDCLAVMDLSDKYQRVEKIGKKNVYTRESRSRKSAPRKHPMARTWWQKLGRWLTRLGA